MGIKKKLISLVSFFIVICIISIGSERLAKSAKASSGDFPQQNSERNYVLPSFPGDSTGRDNQDWAKFWLGNESIITDGEYVVNSTNDEDDGNCNPTHCSLREALYAAYYNPGPDTISFNIPSDDPGCDASGICTIFPEVTLPIIADGETTIDGFSQPGATPNTNPFGQGLNAVYKIVLDGELLLGYPSGISIRTSGNLVRGLVIQHFNTGIEVLDADHNRIEGNFIGTDAQGASGEGNHCEAVSISGIQGGQGSWNNMVGGSAPQARNLISGNDCGGVEIGAGENNKVQGNIIGTDASGTLPLPNQGEGVRVFNASNNNMIGGQASGEANLIAFNDGYGVEIDGHYGAIGNTISRNRIHDNTDGGILLSSGGNAGMVAPEILTATVTIVSGTTCTACSIEVFSDEDGEGAIYEGTTMADSSGIWSFEKLGGFIGPNITTTATDANGNTSEFSTQANVSGSFEKTAPDNSASGIWTNTTLIWSASSGAVSYDYCIDTTNDNTCNDWISTGMNTFVEMSGLDLSTTYFWHVRANNSYGTTYANGSINAYWHFTTVSELIYNTYLPFLRK
jgi:CSLREA domain-containing protein